MWKALSRYAPPSLAAACEALDRAEKVVAATRAAIREELAKLARKEEEASRLEAFLDCELEGATAARPLVIYRSGVLARVLGLEEGYDPAVLLGRFPALAEYDIEEDEVRIAARSVRGVCEDDLSRLGDEAEWNFDEPEDGNGHLEFADAEEVAAAAFGYLSGDYDYDGDQHGVYAHDTAAVPVWTFVPRRQEGARPAQAD